MKIWRAIWGLELHLYSFFYLSDWWEWMTNTIPHLFPPPPPRQRERVHIAQKAWWAPGPLWRGRESLAPIRVRSPNRVARMETLSTDQFKEIKIILRKVLMEFWIRKVLVAIDFGKYYASVSGASSDKISFKYNFACYFVGFNLRPSAQRKMGIKKFCRQYENKKEVITRGCRILPNGKIHNIHKTLGELIQGGGDGRSMQHNNRLNWCFILNGTSFKWKEWKNQNYSYWLIERLLQQVFNRSCG